MFLVPLVSIALEYGPQCVIFVLICVIIILSCIIYADRVKPSKLPQPIQTKAKCEFKKTDTYHNKYINTSFGRTYIEQWFFNSKNNNTTSYDIICVHGITQPMGLAFEFIPYLINKINNKKLSNINTVTSYHLYGRGYSDTPLQPHTISLIISQLSEVILALNITNKLILIGYSLGGPIVTKFTEQYPYKVHKLICIASAGLTVKIRMDSKLLRLPVLGEIAILFAKRILPKSVKSALKQGYNAKKYSTQSQMDIMSKSSFIQINHHPGFPYTILSSLRYFTLTSNDFKCIFDKLYNDTSFNNKNWLFIWSKSDKTCPAPTNNIYSETQSIILNDAYHGDIVAIHCLREYGNKMLEFLNK